MNDFDTQFAESYKHFSDDVRMIARFFPRAVNIETTGIALDKQGADYVVSIGENKDGNIITYKQIFVDVKRRLGTDCFKYSRHGELEIALETYSRIDTKVPGWLVDVKKRTDYLLYVFDKSVCDTGYLFPYQMLRKALIDNYTDWKDKYDIKRQSSRRGNTQYESECLFVPVSVAERAVMDGARMRA